MRFPFLSPKHFPQYFPKRLPKRFPRIRFPDFRFPKIRLPVLTAGEKTALAALVLVLGTGAALRAWERSGVRLGPVDDWDSLRSMLIRAREDHEQEGGGGYACADEAPAGTYGMNARSGAAPEILAAGAAPAKESMKKKGSGSGKKAPPARPVDLNTAGEKTLLSLPGVGPSTARAILTYRTARGPFRSVEDLLQVKGIGPKKLEALRPFAFVKVQGQVEAPGEAPGRAGAGKERGEAPGSGDSTDSRAQALPATGSPTK